jgi:hypothetical protein
MVLGDVIKTDDHMTAMIEQSLSNGALLGGIITTDQQIGETEAERIRNAWRQRHSGAENAGDIAVFGKGATFETIGNTFRDMVLPELDARNETRICMAYEVPPIMISARVGTSVSTYNNYQESRKSFYQRVVSRDWNALAAMITRAFADELDGLVASFDTRAVEAMQEDRNDKFTRAVNGYNAKILTLNEAREEVGLDPVPDGDDFGEEPEQPEQMQPTPAIEAEETEPENDDKTELQAAEEKRFRSFAKNRLRENHPADLTAFKFRHTTPARQAELIAEFAPRPAATADQVIEALRAATEALKRA